MKKYISFLLLLFLASPGFANNISVTNLVYNNAAGTVSFNISWENSWRVNTFQNNWDAAWVFVKRRNCVDQFWKHQLISASGHLAGNPLEIKTTPDSVGVFIQRSAIGSGNIAATAVTLQLSGVPQPTIEWDFKVFAIEMVYVPQGAFYLGGGYGTVLDFRAGGVNAAPNPHPYLVQSEDSIRFGNTVGFLWDGTNSGSSSSPAGNVVSENFPKGFRAFYAMKYEITQGEFVDYLNSLPQDAATAREIVNRQSRNTVTGAWPIYNCSTPARAMNFLSWPTFCSYLDWTGLAPMSEFEYEKLCRGTALPVTGEFAWGTNTLIPATGLIANDGTLNETVNITVLADGLANCSVESGATSPGPYRVGFAAKTGTSRIQSGAGFYGNMELTGNVYEFCLSVAGTTASRFRWDEHGNGLLTASTGLSDVNSWNNASSFAAAAGSLRGGAFGDRYQSSLVNPFIGLVVSWRTSANNTINNGFSQTGGRGVRRLFNQ